MNITNSVEWINGVSVCKLIYDEDIYLFFTHSKKNKINIKSFENSVLKIPFDSFICSLKCIDVYSSTILHITEVNFRGFFSSGSYKL